MKNGQKGDSSFCVITISTLYFKQKNTYDMRLLWNGLNTCSILMKYIKNTTSIFTVVIR